MFLPYETTVSLWFNPNPIYVWEPVPPAPEQIDNAAAAGSSDSASDGGNGSCTPSGLPMMRLVFKGINWTAYPVYGMRENLAWEQAAQTRREVDDENLVDARRDARKEPKPTKPPG